MTIGLTLLEHDAVVSILREWLTTMRERADTIPGGLSGEMHTRFSLVGWAIVFCQTHAELPEQEDNINVVREVLYDFLVVETMNQCRGLLADAELRRLETARGIFAKILANAEIHGRELRTGSVYTVPAELVKLGLYQMLEFPEMQLLNYARKGDGGMLGVIARFFWHQSFGQDKTEIMH